MVKIRGLVAFQNRVRDELLRGVPPEKLDTFRRNIESAVTAVKKLCDDYGMTPDELPGPSRNAYRYLASIDLSSIPATEPSAVQQPRTVKLTRVVSTVNVLSARLWAVRDRLLNDERVFAAVRDELAASARRVEELCAAAGADPSMLDGRTRPAYCWLKFLSEGKRLEDHLLALRSARAAAIRHLPRQRHEIHFLAMSAMWKMDRTRTATRHRFHEGFIACPEPFWDDLFKALGANRRDEFGRMLTATTTEEPFQEVSCELESYAEPGKEHSQGRHYDLDSVFARVNSAYFGGQMQRPVLTWSRRLTSRMFGYYRFANDRLMASQSLDDPSVPEFVVDFIMYHELLHKRLGHLEAASDRRRFHTPAFRAEERRFQEFEEATVFLRQLSERMLASR